MRVYSINTIDSETTPTWMSIAMKVIPAAQDAGKCRYNVTVTSGNEEALISAINADKSVIDYVEIIKEEQVESNKAAAAIYRAAFIARLGNIEL